MGHLTQPVELKKGESVYLTTKEGNGNPKEIPFDYTGALELIENGVQVFVDDGRIVLEVTDREADRLYVKVTVGGVLKSRKGVNMPDVEFPFAGPTPKDRDDVEFAVSGGVDYIAQSFVRSGQDIRDVRDLVASRLPECRFVAKVENRTALQNIDGIIAESDAVMVARGDLGISVPIYQVPMIQKDIIRRCVRAGKPVIVGGLPHERGVASTASYEARKYGVHSGMPLRKAYELCPHGVFVRGNYQIYNAFSKKFIQILSRYSPDVE